MELFDQVDFKEAVKRLSDNGFKIKTSPAKTKQPTVKEKKLLARVVSYYQHSFTRCRGLTYLKQERGIINNQSLTDFGTGYVNGTLLDRSFRIWGRVRRSPGRVWRGFRA